MGEIGGGLRARADRIAHRMGAGAEAGHLWEDEPHPMGLLPPAPQLALDGLGQRPLRRDEALEVMGVRFVRHGAVSFRPG